MASRELWFRQVVDMPLEVVAVSASAGPLMPDQTEELLQGWISKAIDSELLHLEVAAHVQAVPYSICSDSSATH